MIYKNDFCYMNGLIHIHYLSAVLISWRSLSTQVMLSLLLLYYEISEGSACEDVWKICCYVMLQYSCIKQLYMVAQHSLYWKFNLWFTCILTVTEWNFSFLLFPDEINPNRILLVIHLLDFTWIVVIEIWAIESVCY